MRAKLSHEVLTGFSFRIIWIEGKKRRDEGKERKTTIFVVRRDSVLSTGNGSYRIPLSVLEGGWCDLFFCSANRPAN